MEGDLESWELTLYGRDMNAPIAADSFNFAGSLRDEGLNSLAVNPAQQHRLVLGSAMDRQR